MEFEAAEISITTCTENHVHIRLRPVDGGGPTYDTHFDADTARRFACTVLEAAADIAPVSDVPEFVSAVAVLEEAQRRHPEAVEAIVAILDKDGRTLIYRRCSPSQMAYVASKLLVVAGSE